jgi:hypothetical protein
MPQVVGFIGSRQNQGEPIEAMGVRPRQVRYQAALRPDPISRLILKPVPRSTPPETTASSAALHYAVGDVGIGNPDRPRFKTQLFLLHRQRRFVHAHTGFGDDAHDVAQILLGVSSKALVPLPQRHTNAFLWSQGEAWHR